MKDTVTLNIDDLIKIIRSVDHGCTYCAQEAAELLEVYDPDHKWVELVMDNWNGLI